MDELAKIASGRTTITLDIFSRDLHQPSVKIDDTLKPEKASAQPEVPSTEPEEALAEPEVPSAVEEEALPVEGGTEWGHTRSELADLVPGISPPKRASPRRDQSSAAGSARQVVHLAG